MFKPLGLSLAAILLSYVFIFWRQVKDKGLDPSLINYSNPLTFRGLWPLRVCLGTGLVAIFIWPAIGYFLLGLVLFGCLVQMFLLFLFLRLPTQPAFYYGCSGGAGLILLLRPDFYGVLIAAGLILAQEIYLAMYWSKRQAAIYNRWVSRKSRRLDHRFREIFHKMPPRLRFLVLHIAVTEDIARPPVVRLAEKLYFKVKRPAMISSGIMQVASDRILSDAESLRLGAKLVQKALDSMPASTSTPRDEMVWLAQVYNGSRRYSVYLEATSPGVSTAWAAIKRKS